MAKTKEHCRHLQSLTDDGQVNAARFRLCHERRPFLKTGTGHRFSANQDVLAIEAHGDRVQLKKKFIGILLIYMTFTILIPVFTGSPAQVE
jgi:hypothetical protein